MSPGVDGHHISTNSEFVPSDVSMKVTIMVSMTSSQDVAGKCIHPTISSAPLSVSSAPVTVCTESFLCTILCTSKNSLYTINIFLYININSLYTCISFLNTNKNLLT